MAHEVLKKYVPESAIPLMVEWIKTYHFHFTISKNRSSKLGDFRPSFKGKPARISVNGDLNPYHFLITFTHEVAHAAVWEKHANKVNPHGIEWQNQYVSFLKRLISIVDFPTELLLGTKKHMQRPKASSCADPKLYKLLQAYNKDQKAVLYLDDLNEGEVFIVRQKRIFKKGSKRRSRFECLDIRNNKVYLISGHVEVEPYRS